MKSGQYVRLNNQIYIFLGYIDYKKSRAVIADHHGNKIDIFVHKLNIYHDK